RARKRAARQSGRSEAREGRRIAPAKTISSTPSLRRSSKPRPAAPSRIQACGAFATVAGSVSPSKARTKNGRSSLLHASISRAGRSPEPARMPSLPGIRRARLADRTRGVGPDELDDLAYGPRVFVERGDVVDTLHERALLREEEMIGAAQRLQVVAREAAALEASNVEPGQTRPVAHHRAVRDDVMLDAGHAADHRMATDADELVHSGKAAEHRIIADHDVPAQGRVVRHDDVVADLTVVRNVNADHEKAVAADARHHPAALGAG